MEDYLGYRVLDSDSSCLALYFFQSENLKESVNECTYGSVSAGREKWPFNVLFFFKSRASV